MGGFTEQNVGGITRLKSVISPLSNEVRFEIVIQNKA